MNCGYMRGSHDVSYYEMLCVLATYTVKANINFILRKDMYTKSLVPIQGGSKNVPVAIATRAIKAVHTKQLSKQISEAGM